MIFPIARSICHVSLLLLSYALLVVPPSLFADYYKYTDESGSVNVTNNLHNVPAQYRSSATVIKESDLNNMDRSPENKPQSSRPRAVKRSPANVGTSDTTTPANEKNGATADTPSSTTGFGWIDRQLPLLKNIVIIALLLAVVGFAGKIISAYVPRTVGILINMALVIGLIVYVFSVYADKVAKSFALIKTESAVVQKAVDNRPKLIDKQVDGQ